ncbi:hypothetical protein EJB05_07780 [Eragrostis curvula]|uniref:Uncharacterized protein n=1 Tax=Eragrostis curvula TaxID=38414 RepID=A0A5J9WLK4_9POAL|nr:hypothetical protein EJB05_07780 [Eragrostis curvula]
MPAPLSHLQPFAKELMRWFVSTRIQDSRTGRKALCKIYVTDGSETVPVSLWKEHAHRFPAEEVVSMSKQAAVAILLLDLTVGWHENQLQLQGSPTCKWYINPAMTETVALQDRYAYMMGHVQLIGDTTASAAPKPTAVTELFSVEDPHQIWLIGAPVGALLDAGGGAQGFIPPPIAHTFGRQYKFQLSVPQNALGRDRPSFKINAVEAIAPLNAVNQIETHGSSSNVIGQTSEAKDHPPANAIPIDPTTTAKVISLHSTNAPRKSSVARKLDLDAAYVAKNDVMTEAKKTSSSDMKTNKARVNR